MTGTLDLGAQNIAVDRLTKVHKSGNWTRTQLHHTGYIDLRPGLILVMLIFILTVLTSTSQRTIC